MRREQTYGYLAQGYKMSPRARIAEEHDEHTINYFIKLFGLPEAITKQFLVYMGNHHTDSYYYTEKFYRLPDKDDPEELEKIFKAFHSIHACRRKFIEVMSAHLQKCINDKDREIPASERPRKRRKRRKSYRGKWSTKGRGGRKSSLNRKDWRDL